MYISYGNLLSVPVLYSITRPHVDALNRSAEVKHQLRPGDLQASAIVVSE